MKKSFFLITAFLLLAFSTQAQFKLGVKGGPSLTKYRGTPQPTKAVAGFHLGAFANFAFSDNVSLQPELLFSRQGAKSNISHNIFLDGTVKDHLNYLALPLLAKFNTNFGLTFESGFQLSYLLSGSSSFDYPNNPTNVQPTDLDLKKDDYIKDGDMSFLVGAGYELPSGLSLNIRSAIGLSNIGQNAKYYNLAFQLSLGFPLIAL